jgi:hypothetical protein
MFAFFCATPIPRATVIEVGDAIRSVAREEYGKQETAADHMGYDAPRFSRDLNGPGALFVARLVKAGLLPKVLERIGAEQNLKARLETLERRIADLESKKESA